MSDKQAQDLVEAVVAACLKVGHKEIITLWGVPGTGKTRVAQLAAKKVANHDAFIKRVQFHQSFSYEDFIEGMRPNGQGGFDVVPGIFTQWNNSANNDPAHHYVLVIEELTRANVSAVLGELLTFIEHREEPFELPISRRSVTVAANMRIIATMNPRDRSALALDDAVIRRMRVILCPPSVKQVREVLEKTVQSNSEEGQQLIAACQQFMQRCQDELGERFSSGMPFGHGVFDGVSSWDDLGRLWAEKLEPLLFRPNMPSDDVADLIRKEFPKSRRRTANSADSQAEAT